MSMHARKKGGSKAKANRRRRAVAPGTPEMMRSDLFDRCTKCGSIGPVAQTTLPDSTAFYLDPKAKRQTICRACLGIPLRGQAAVELANRQAKALKKMSRKQAAHIEAAMAAAEERSPAHQAKLAAAVERTNVASMNVAWMRLDEWMTRNEGDEDAR